MTDGPRWPTIVRVTNANPRPLYLIRDGIHLDTLAPGDQVGVVASEGLRMATPRGRSKVVVQTESEYYPAEEWVQAVGDTPVALDPKLALEGALVG